MKVFKFFYLFDRLFCTLADIGLLRLQRRFRYELRQILDRRLPPLITLAWVGALGAPPGWRIHNRKSLVTLTPPLLVSSHPRFITFTFLNESRQLSWPIHWNNPHWTRLWQFHLHYFDWAREWLHVVSTTGIWPDQLNISSRSLIPGFHLILLSWRWLA